MKKKNKLYFDHIRSLATSKCYLLALVFGAIDIALSLFSTIYRTLKQSTYSYESLDDVSITVEKGVFDYIIPIAVVLISAVISSYLLFKLYKVRISLKNCEECDDDLRSIPVIMLFTTIPILLYFIYNAYANAHPSIGILIFAIVFFLLIVVLFQWIFYRSIKKTINYALSLIANKPSGKASKLLRIIVAFGIVIRVERLALSFHPLMLLTIFSLASEMLFLYILLTFDRPLEAN